MVKDVVCLGTELNFQALQRRVELLVEREIGLVESRGTARIARRVTERAQQVSASVLSRAREG